MLTHAQENIIEKECEDLSSPHQCGKDRYGNAGDDNKANDKDDNKNKIHERRKMKNKSGVHPENPPQFLRIYNLGV